ncbi:MAG: ATP-binding cassette domain-containing protein [Bacteroidales bacterium]|nr:ATP-binding cassette domain-containing protein [Bacteroidales bacterium]
MKKEILEALIHLFSIISVFYKGLSEDEALNFIEVFLESEYHLENVSDYTLQIESQLQYYKNTNNYNNELLYALCNNIKGKLPKKLRVLILIHVMQFLKFSGKVQGSLFTDSKENEASRIIANEFNIDTEEFTNFAAFISNILFKVKNKEQLLIISRSSILPDKVRFIERDGLDGKITFLYIKSVNLYLFNYEGDQEIFLNNKPLYNRYLYVFSHNTVISGDNFNDIYYNEILAGFSNSKYEFSRINYEARNISYKFKNSSNGIHQFSIAAKSFQFIGILGGSGSGKTTLMNLLNGNIEPQIGEIAINGKIFSKQKNKVKGIIGYVPQEDSLIEELSIFENLYFQAKFCFANLNKEQIKEKVNNLLTELDLYEFKDLVVGSILKKLISGGQRKRLNIALELIREPYILLVDEPTSGLSSSDAEKIVYLLADQVRKGRLVITNIHQPSSEIFKLFDQLIILDKGGYPVYQGPPTEVFDYFRQKTGRVDILKNLTKHGYFIPEEIFRLLEEKKLNEYGETTAERVHSPQEWFDYFIKTKKVLEKNEENMELPAPNFQPPNKIKQVAIYFKRNFVTKLGDKQYLLVALLIAPILALILGYFTKNTTYSESGVLSYSFSLNENIPSFFFMSVIVSLFIGLIVSAEEIIVDRKLMLRESFLNLSRNAYLNAKILFLLLLSFIQSALYVIICTLILSIPDIGFKFFIIMFSLSSFANILGLVISASMRSIIAVYITIPLILIPQLLLSGVVVNFDDLHYSISSKKYVPFVGDIMASRWGFEALIVEQFKNNKYEKLFFDTEKKISDYSYIQYHVIPFLTNVLNDCRQNYKPGKDLLIKNGFEQIAKTAKLKIPEFSSFADSAQISNATEFLRKCKEFISDEINNIMKAKDDLMMLAMQKFDSKNAYINFKNKHYNESIARFVKQDNLNSKKMIIANNEIIRKSEPIFHTPANHLGRSHFYAPVKNIGNTKIDTFWFNTIQLWLMWLTLYIVLSLNVPDKMVWVKNKILTKKI